MNHSFNVEIATKYGIEAAVLIENIAFWVNRNAANRKHFHDGYYWTYNSAKAYSELFPYINQRKIARVLLDLENAGMIKSAYLNENKYNRTKWFTITEKALKYFINQNGETAFVILSNGNDDMSNAECDFDKSTLSDINLTDINTSINHSERTETIDNTYPTKDETKQNIQLEQLKQKYPQKKNELQELYEIIVEVLRSRKTELHIAKEDMPADEVKRAYKSIHNGHIEYVLDCLSKNTSKVKNTKAYLQTALYNASKTMNNHYSFDAQNSFHEKLNL